MFCQKCGANLVDGAQFCNNCGSPTVMSGTPNMMPAGGMQYGNQYGNQYGDQFGNPYTNQYGGAYLPMNWYKFLVYFAVWAGAVLNMVNGGRIISGSQYEGLSSLVYSMYPGLKALDIVAGLAVIIVGALGILAAVSLLQYKKVGIKYLLLLYTLSASITFVYYLLGTIIIKANCFKPAIIMNIAVSVTMIFVNKVYFEKRAHMFK